MTSHKPLLQVVGRATVVLYGLFYALLTIWGMADSFANKISIVQLAFDSVRDLVSCYGIFALAIPQLRSRLIASLWGYVAYALPVLTYADIGWVIWYGDPLAPKEAVVLVAVLLIVTAPAVVFNFMLYRQLNVEKAERLTNT